MNKKILLETVLWSFMLILLGFTQGYGDGGSGGPAVIPRSSVTETILLRMESTASVKGAPANKTLITVKSSTHISRMFTYHWNQGGGDTPGTISLKNTATGAVIGTWKAVGLKKFPNGMSAGALWPATTNGPPYLYWTVQPNVDIPAGTYEIVDSKPSTWSANSEVGNKGITWVYGWTASTSGGVTVQPSSQNRTVSAGGVSVIIPGGLLRTSATLSVKPSTVAPQLPKPIAGMKMLGSYDISLGSSARFAKNITLELPYDPATLDSTLPEGKNLWVTSWSEQDNRWCMERAEVDTVRKRIVIRTNHLSTWAFWSLQGYKYVPSAYGPFEVYYHPNHRQPRSDVAATYTMRDLANDTVTALTTARQAYKDAGFRVPNSQVKAIITDTGSTWSTWSGNIMLDRGTLTLLDIVREHCGHELFHTVQNQYFNIQGMNNRRWWIEGTPDYASSAVAWNGKIPLPVLEKFYFSQSLIDSTDEHAYQNSQFINYLVKRRNLSFKAMWDAVASNSGYGDNGLPAFKSFVGSNTFDQVWTDFVGYALFDPSKPPMKNVETIDLLLTNANPQRSAELTVPANYTAKFVLVNAIAALGQQTRPVKLSASGLASGASVQIWRTKNHDRRSARFNSVLTAGQAKSSTFNLGTGDDLFVVVLNAGSEKRNVTVTATTEAVVTAPPPSKTPDVRCADGTLPTCQWYQSGLYLYCANGPTAGARYCKIKTTGY